MTRGTMCLITEDKVFCAVEFNGDQYYDGLGKKSAMLIQNVHTEEDLEKAAICMNENYGYEEETWVYEQTKRFTYEELLNTKDEYVKKYFSDYIFIINRSGKDLEFKTYDGKRILPNNESGVLHFGGIASDFPPYIDAFKRHPNKFLKDSDMHYDADPFSETEKREIEEKTGGNGIAGFWDSWESLIKQEAKKKGAYVRGYEKYFDFKMFAKDMGLTDRKDLIELSTGKIVRAF